MLYNIFQSRLTLYVDEIIMDHQCEFRRNRSTTDQIFRFHQIPEKKWEYSGTVNQVFTDSKKASDPVRTEELRNTEFSTPMKLVRLIKMCLNQTNSKSFR
jgi:hypothetical protein